jgi:propanediol utilization protein
VGNIEYLTREEQVQVVTAVASELRRLVEKWNGLEVQFAVRAAARNIHVPEEDAIYGLKYGISQGHLKIKYINGDEGSLLVAGSREQGRR